MGGEESDEMEIGAICAFSIKELFSLVNIWRRKNYGANRANKKKHPVVNNSVIGQVLAHLFSIVKELLRYICNHLYIKNSNIIKFKISKKELLIRQKVAMTF